LNPAFFAASFEVDSRNGEWAVKAGVWNYLWVRIPSSYGFIPGRGEVNAQDHNSAAGGLRNGHCMAKGRGSNDPRSTQER